MSQWVSCSMVSFVICAIGGSGGPGMGFHKTWSKRYELADPGSIELCGKDIGWLLRQFYTLGDV